MTVTPPAVNEPRPIPPRYWWLKRIAASVVVLVVVLGGLRWWWGAHAHAKLQAEIDRIRAAGEPIDPGDLDLPPVPNDENAAILLREAATIAANSSPRWYYLPDSPYDGPDADSMTATWIELGNHVRKNVDALDLVRRARSHSGVDWGITFQAFAAAPIGPLSPQRELARLLRAAVAHAHHVGDDAGAVETIRDMLAHAAAVDKQPAMLWHLVAVAIDSLALDAAQTITSSLAVADTTIGKDAPVKRPSRNRPATNFLSKWIRPWTQRFVALAPKPDARPAARAQVDALIRDLLDERSLRQALLRAHQSNRMEMVDTIRQLATGSTSLGVFLPFTPSFVSGWRQQLLLAPIFETDGLRMIRAESSVIDALRDSQIRWRTLEPSLRAATPGAASGLDHFTQFAREFLYFRPTALATIQFRYFAERRMAAVALAIRLYELDHGARPAALRDLVPDYLAELPADPFAPSGGTFRYRPQADPPVLYSVGPNGTDENGAGGGFVGADYEWDANDLPLRLDGRLGSE